MNTNQLTYKIGLWSAIATTFSLAAFAIAFTLTMILFPSAVIWQGIEAYASSYQQTLMFFLMFFPFVLAPCFLTLMAVIYHITPDDKKILGLLSLVFVIVYAAQISLNYYIQLTSIESNLLAGNLEGLAILTFFNPTSIPLHTELLGYGMLSIGMIFASFLFSKGQRNKTIFWIFLINGILNAYYIFDPFIGIGGPPIVLALFNYSVPIATLLIALQFHRTIKTKGESTFI
jgi:hypothetical protein